MTTAFARTFGIAVLFAFLLAALPAQAAEQSAARKVGRGLAALTCGFLEVPGNIVKLTRERNAVWGFTLGTAVGAGKIVPRVLVGAYEFLTAPLPYPSGFQPILQPEFPWGYFDDPPRRR